PPAHAELRVLLEQPSSHGDAEPLQLRELRERPAELQQPQPHPARLYRRRRVRRLLQEAAVELDGEERPLPSQSQQPRAARERRAGAGARLRRGRAAQELLQRRRERGPPPVDRPHAEAELVSLREPGAHERARSRLRRGRERERCGEGGDGGEGGEDAHGAVPGSTAVHASLFGAWSNGPEVARRSGTAYRVVRRLARLLVRLLYRLQVEGAERLPPRGSLIVVANHESVLDAVVLGAALGRELRFLTKAELWRIPLLGRVLDALGGIAVERGRGDLAALARARDALEAGEAVALFPQGFVRREG